MTKGLQCSTSTMIDFDRQIERYYQDLRRNAHHLRAGYRVQSGLETTALVHEAYVRMRRAVQRGQASAWQTIVGLARAVMRQVLIDAHRYGCRDKRDPRRLDPDHEADAAGYDPALTDHSQLSTALCRLRQLDSRLAQLVELRFAHGLSIGEIASELARSERSVKRDLQKVRFLLSEWCEL